MTSRETAQTAIETRFEFRYAEERGMGVPPVGAQGEVAHQRACHASLFHGRDARAPFLWRSARGESQRNFKKISTASRETPPTAIETRFEFLISSLS